MSESEIILQCCGDVQRVEAVAALVRNWVQATHGKPLARTLPVVAGEDRRAVELRRYAEHLAGIYHLHEYRRDPALVMDEPPGPPPKSFHCAMLDFARVAAHFLVPFAAAAERWKARAYRESSLETKRLRAFAGTLAALSHWYVETQGASLPIIDQQDAGIVIILFHNAAQIAREPEAPLRQTACRACAAGEAAALLIRRLIESADAIGLAYDAAVSEVWLGTAGRNSNGDFVTLEPGK